MMAAVAVIATFAASNDCKAGYSILLKSGSSSLLITDNNVAPGAAGFDKNSTAGGITTLTTAASGANSGGIVFAGYRLGIDSSSGSPDGNIGLYTQTKYRLFNNSATNKLTITVTSDGFDSPGIPGDTLNLVNYLEINRWTGSSGDKITAYSYAFPDLATTGLVTGNTQGFSGQSNSLFHRSGSTYTITQVMEVTLSQGGAASFVGTANVVTPVPSALILAAFGIPAFGLLRRRFAKKVEMTTAA